MTTKEQFFSQYWGQKVLKLNPSIDTYEICAKHLYKLEKIINEGIAYLLLTDLTYIIDEDAIEVAKIMGFRESLKENGITFIKQLKTGITMTFNHHPLHTLGMFQYLQEKGYAVPYRNYSINDLISMGWIKLKTRENIVTENQ